MGNQRPQQWSQSKVGPRGRAHMGFDVTEWCNGKKAWPVVSVRNVLGSNDQKPTAGSKKERFYPLMTRIQRYIAASTGSRMSAPKPDFLRPVLQSTRWLLRSQPYICISSRKKVEAWWRGEGEASLSSQQMLSPEGLQHIPTSAHGLERLSLRRQCQERAKGLG